MLGEGRGEQSLDLSLVTYVCISISRWNLGESRGFGWYRPASPTGSPAAPSRSGTRHGVRAHRLKPPFIARGNLRAPRPSPRREQPRDGCEEKARDYTVLSVCA